MKTVGIILGAIAIIVIFVWVIVNGEKNKEISGKLANWGKGEGNREGG